MTGRERILRSVRMALSGANSPTSRISAAEIYPTFFPSTTKTENSGHELAALFADRLRANCATVTEIADWASAPLEVERYLSDSGLEPLVRTGFDPRLEGVDWSKTPRLRVERGPGRFDNFVGLTYAIAGVAEIGALLVASGRANPVTLSFTQATNIVLLDHNDIVATYEEAWALAQKLFAPNLPRTLNLISGPSRTADIGGRPVLGAHGPAQMLVLIIGAHPSP